MPELYRVNASILNLRSSPETSSRDNVISRLPTDHVVEKLASIGNGDWWKVSTRVANAEEIGYTASRYLLPFDPPKKKLNPFSNLFSNIDASIENVRSFVGGYALDLDDDLAIKLNQVLDKYKINRNAKRFTHFISQIAHETGHFTRFDENLNYSAQGLRRVFTKYFPTDQLAQEYARQPEKIANRVYANRMGNGDEASGDGWKYRGRGYIQLTGKANYAEIGRRIGRDLVSDPDIILREPEIALLTAAEYWDSRDLNRYADKDDIKAVTKRINGGYNGLEHRQQLLNKARHIWRA